MPHNIQERFKVGKTFQTHLKVDEGTVERFAELSGDRNPIHVDSAEAKAYGFARPVAHGALLVAALSKLIGMEIPGPGAVWMNQSIEWLSPVFIDDEITLTAKIENVSQGAGTLGLGLVATNQKGKTVMKGNANVKVGEKLSSKNVAQKKTAKVALVTGASRGVGAAIAERLAQNGLSVAVNYRESEAQAKEVVQKIQGNKGIAHAFRADLGNSAVVSSMVDEITGTLGSIDIVVHGASPFVQPVKVADLTYNDLEPFFKTYLGGALTLIAKTKQEMINQKFGRFIFLGTSFMFGIPPAGTAAYVAAKEALWGLVKAMASELGPFGITTNMISPSMMITDFTADIPSRMKEVEAHKSPMRRLASVEDAANLAAFLTSDAASYLNGCNLPVTGGPI